jgi:hypothetical protein
MGNGVGGLESVASTNTLTVPLTVALAITRAFRMTVLPDGFPVSSIMITCHLIVYVVCYSFSHTVIFFTVIYICHSLRKSDSIGLAQTGFFFSRRRFFGDS